MRDIKGNQQKPVLNFAKITKMEILYNGLKMPEKWPPVLSLESLSEPHEPLKPPEIVNIDVGRQLFVDDFLIEKTETKRVFHRPELHPSSPVLVPDKPWEKTYDTHQLAGPSSMVFSDGVWYDPEEKLFKMWYMGGFLKSTCYAISQDGIRWEKPALDIVNETNIVHTSMRDSSTVWLDLEEKDKNKRYKLFVFELEKEAKGTGTISVYFSKDGIHWSDKILQTGKTGDRTTVFYNPFRKLWVYSVRDFIPAGPGRFRRYHETADIINGSMWELEKLPVWIGSDRFDFIRDDLKTRCQLYNLDCVAYESIMLGLFSIWRGQPSDRPKICEICTGFSRDGFFWHRPDRRPFIGVSENKDDWNWGNVQSAGGCCLVVNDKLYFYVSGRKFATGKQKSELCSSSVAILRRDGFASMEAGESELTLTTRKLNFSGKHLFINVDSRNGYIVAEIIDRDGNVIQPFSKERCIAVSCNSTSVPVKWQNVENLSDVSRKPVRIKFYLKNSSLYSFWVSNDTSGKSNGFVAAGGPEFEGNRDE
ncbi:MAG: glycosyl hydrolase family 32 [Candidatus Omnitrophica bacterium]|nr:glycosyl hydrolase family 32 [Candidatus Omnitrophota bacterium]